MLKIRALKQNDAPNISAAFLAQGWHKPTAQYEQYWQESQVGSRSVILAELEGEFAGYLTIMWQSNYPPFYEANIPEVVDFNVLQKFQRQGIGTALMDEAEQLIAQRSTVAGIGFGLMHDYGNAQILYAKRGYVPDGRGVFGHGRWLEDGDEITMGHDIALYLVKTVQHLQIERV